MSDDGGRSTGINVCHLLLFPMEPRLANRQCADWHLASPPLPAGPDSVLRSPTLYGGGAAHRLHLAEALQWPPQEADGEADGRALVQLGYPMHHGGVRFPLRCPYFLFWGNFD